MGPFPGSPSWESSHFSPSSVSGRRAQGSASFQAPPGHLSWQVSSWSLGSLLLAGPCPACGGGGGDVCWHGGGVYVKWAGTPGTDMQWGTSSPHL